MEWNGMEWNGMEWNGMEWNENGCSIQPILEIYEDSRARTYDVDIKSIAL